MMEVITIVRRSPAVMALSASSFLTCRCTLIALATSMVWSDLEATGWAPSSFRKASVADSISSSVTSDLLRRSPTLGISLATMESYGGSPSLSSDATSLASP